MNTSMVHPLYVSSLSFYFSCWFFFILCTTHINTKTFSNNDIGVSFIQPSIIQHYVSITWHSIHCAYFLHGLCILTKTVCSWVDSTVSVLLVHHFFGGLFYVSQHSEHLSSATVLKFVGFTFIIGRIY